MLTLTSLGGTTVRVTGAGKNLLVFPESGKHDAKDDLVLLPVPEEQLTPNVICWPGEYNEGGVSIKGIGHLEGQQVSYVVDADDYRLAFLSSPLQDWSDAQKEVAGDIDVLVLPTSDQKLVQKLVDEFDPRVLVLLPVSDDAGATLKAVGATASPVSEHKLKGSLPAEGREVVVLTK